MCLQRDTESLYAFVRDADTRKIPECSDVSVRFCYLVCPTRIARYLLGEDFVNFRAIGSCLSRAQFNSARIAQKCDCTRFFERSLLPHLMLSFPKPAI